MSNEEKIEMLSDALRDCLRHGITHAVGCSHKDETRNCHRAKAIKALALAEGKEI